MSFESKNPLVKGRQLKAQRLSIPFSLTANATPALVVLSSDEREILFMQSQGINQINSLVDPGSIEPPPGSPDLGNAIDFEILGASTITNTGATIVTGDLGLYPGTSVTGFPPGTVIGTQHITDGLANLAQTDANAAFLDLTGRPATQIAAALDAQVLGPGVYTESSGTFNLAASGNGTLTLNGSSSDLFIFQATSTLTTGAGGTPTIVLTGGALASNVYWVVGSSASLNVSGTGAHAGSVIALASVTINGGSSNGRLIALNGAVTISAATALNLPNPLISNNPVDADGQLNFLVKISPEDECFKVLRAYVIRRSDGSFQPTFLSDADGIDINGDIILSMDSTVDFTTTNFDGDLNVEYVVVE